LALAAVVEIFDLHDSRTLNSTGFVRWRRRYADLVRLLPGAVQARFKEPLAEREMTRELEGYYQLAWERVIDSLRAALVIDLSNGESDALPLARALERTKNFVGSIAYWNPQKGE